MLVDGGTEDTIVIEVEVVGDTEVGGAVEDVPGSAVVMVRYGSVTVRVPRHAIRVVV